MQDVGQKMPGVPSISQMSCPFVRGIYERSVILSAATSDHVAAEGVLRLELARLLSHSLNDQLCDLEPITSLSSTLLSSSEIEGAELWVPLAMGHLSVSAGKNSWIFLDG